MGEFYQSKIHSPFSSFVFSETSKPYLIAEIGLNHNRSLELARDMIHAAAENGANAVKFQSYTTEEFINRQVPGTEELFSIFKRYELSLLDHGSLVEEARSAGVDFISTPLTMDWVNFLADLKTPFIKVASGDLNNYMLLKHIVSKKIPMIVSTGNSSTDDIERASSFFKLMGKKDVIFLHCVSEYPTSLHNLNLSTITFLKQKLGSLTGFSDHSAGSEAAFAAVMLGAVVVEKHFTIDRKLPGPDHQISATPDELKEIRERMDTAFEMRGEPRTEPYLEEKSGDFFGKRSIYIINGKKIAMRPRQPGLPRDSDFFSTI